MRDHNRRLHRLDMGVYATTEYEYHFTICARHQGTPFLDERLAEKVIESLLWTKRNYDWTLFCYCLMPDHLHFVCRLTDNDIRYINAGARGVVPEGVLDHVGRFKSYTTQQAWKLGIHGELWQKSSYDRVLDWRRPFEEVCWYVLMNPVRKGLVKDPDDWLYSDIVDAW